MKGYKVEYNYWGYDCWGKPELGFWEDYDNEVFLSKDKCVSYCNSLERSHGSDYLFRIKEVEINE